MVAKKKFTTVKTPGIYLEGSKSLARAMRVLGDQDAPFLKDALVKSNNLLAAEIRSRATGGLANSVHIIGLKGEGSARGLRAVVQVRHPGSRSVEFGRVKYYTDFTGGNNRPGSKRKKGSIRRTGTLVTRRGQRPRTYVGIKHGSHAIGATAPEISKILSEAIDKEWARLAEDE